MNKIVNCEAIQPTKKPKIAHKSHHIEHPQIKPHSNSFSHKKKTFL